MVRQAQTFSGPERRITQRRNGRDRRGVYLSEPDIDDRRRLPTRRKVNYYLGLTSSD